MIQIPELFFSGDRQIWPQPKLCGRSPTTGEEIEYTPDLFTLTVYFRGTGTALESIARLSNDLSGFVFDISGANTELMLGLYTWHTVITDLLSTDKITIATGTATVIQGLSAVSEPIDPRTIAEQQLDTVNAAILERSSGVKEYKVTGSVGGREVQYYDLSELINLRNSLQITIAREKLGGILRAQYRFVNPGSSDGSAGYT